MLCFHIGREQKPWIIQEVMHMRRSRPDRFTALIIAVAVVCVISYYLNFETVHTIHHCTGAGCPVCHQIHVAESVVKQLHVMAVPVMAVLFMPFTDRFVFSFEPVRLSLRNLVTDKVRLDN
jgi:hypothetical protein